MRHCPAGPACVTIGSLPDSPMVVHDVGLSPAQAEKSPLATKLYPSATNVAARSAPPLTASVPSRFDQAAERLSKSSNRPTATPPGSNAGLTICENAPP